MFRGSDDLLDRAVEDKPCQVKTQGWVSRKQSNQDDNGGDAYAAFNALDSILKDSLERLRTVRY